MSRITRRTFLWLTGGSSLALATDAPRKMVNKLIPHVVPPEHVQPGEWMTIATTCRECPAGCGMHVWHRDGRVTKVEGNPQHPVNRGGLCSRGQSSLQGLYDPDRLQGVVKLTKRRDPVQASWEEAFSAVGTRLKSGGKVAVVSSLQTGTLVEVGNAFAAAFASPSPLWYEPFHYEPLKSAHRKMFGLASIPTHKLDRCELIISFAADFLETWVSPVAQATQFGQMRSYQPGGSQPGRFVYVGPRLSMTAANADEFLQVPPGWEGQVAQELLRIIVANGWNKRSLGALDGAIKAAKGARNAIPGVSAEKLNRLAKSFASAGSAVALAGPVAALSPQATSTASAVALLNYATGRIGQTVDFSRAHALSRTASDRDLLRLLASLGPADTLLIHDLNLVYMRPVLAKQLQRIGMVVCLGTLMDETMHAADWVLPIDSPLESWGDYEPEAGIHGIMQPCLGRQLDTRPAGDIFIELARSADRTLSSPRGEQPESFEAWLHQRWANIKATQAPAMPANLFWKNSLKNGGFWRPAAGPGNVALQPNAAAALDMAAPPARQEESGLAELWLWPSPMLFDGRLANRGWLQEAPDPISFIVWGNWIDIHPDQAKALGLHRGDAAELSTPAGTLQAAVRITTEIAPHTVALAFGQGHQALGKNAAGIGVNAFVIFNGEISGSVFGTCRIRRIGPAPTHRPVPTITTREQHEREILQWVPWSEVRRMRAGDGEDLVLPLPEGYREQKDMYSAPADYKRHRWAMVVDLQRCIGCGACTVACYAENNVAVIGAELVGNGREMAWLRVVPYRKPDSGMRIAWLPSLCQHCDAAPCEPVCPVFAAMHNEEGLNAQIYNRCIGTRYCSNNCPYKVRRFNWINPTWRKPLDLQLNPEVTVRSRGVMEKCTFCVQRIRQVEYRAAVENRNIADGEIQTACMQSCPTRVYTFGDLLDPHSQVSRLTRSDPRRYHVLEDLNTKPAVTYLRRIDMEA